MAKFVVLLRGINVGGRNSLPMQDLRDILVSLGCECVKTYIQSGNVVLAAKAAPDDAAITAAIEERFGFAPRVLVVPADRFEAIAQANPYKDKGVDGKCLHVLFAAGDTSVDVAALEARKSPTEECKVTADALYLCAPDGIARSKVANEAEKLIGVEATGRNWNTVCKLLEMLA